MKKTSNDDDNLKKDFFSLEKLLSVVSLIVEDLTLAFFV